MIPGGNVQIGHAVALSVEGTTEALTACICAVVASYGDPLFAAEINVSRKGKGLPGEVLLTAVDQICHHTELCVGVQNQSLRKHRITLPRKNRIAVVFPLTVIDKGICKPYSGGHKLCLRELNVPGIAFQGAVICDLRTLQGDRRTTVSHGDPRNGVAAPGTVVADHTDPPCSIRQSTCVIAVLDRCLGTPGKEAYDPTGDFIGGIHISIVIAIADRAGAAQATYEATAKALGGNDICTVIALCYRYIVPQAYESSYANASGNGAAFNTEGADLSIPHTAEEAYKFPGGLEDHEILYCVTVPVEDTGEVHAATASPNGTEAPLLQIDVLH